MQWNLGRSLLLLVLASAAANAQEAADEARAAEIDELEPAVTSEELAEEREEIEPSQGSEVISVARDELEPPVPSAVLAQDIRRRATDTGVMDEIDLGRTEITGNQELPKVLYIVPWQKSEPGDLMGRPVNTLLDEVLAPIDRSEFIRQVDYYSDLYREEEE